MSSSAATKPAGVREVFTAVRAAVGKWFDKGVTLAEYRAAIFVGQRVTHLAEEKMVNNIRRYEYGVTEVQFAAGDTWHPLTEVFPK